MRPHGLSKHPFFVSRSATRRLVPPARQSSLRKPAGCPLLNPPTSLRAPCPTLSRFPLVFCRATDRLRWREKTRVEGAPRDRVSSRQSRRFAHFVETLPPSLRRHSLAPCVMKRGPEHRRETNSSGHRITGYMRPRDAGAGSPTTPTRTTPSLTRNSRPYLKPLFDPALYSSILSRNLGPPHPVSTRN